MKSPEDVTVPAGDTVHPVPALDFQYLSKLCHELKTPLFPLIALTDLILNHPETLERREEMAAHMQVMQKAGQSLLSIIDDLRLISKIGSGRYNPKVGLLRIEDIFSSDDDYSIRALENTVETEEIICDREALEILTACLSSLQGTYNPRPIQAMNVSTNAHEIQLSISLPELPPNELEKLTPPFVRPPWSIHSEGQNQSLKFDLCFVLTQALGGQAVFEPLEKSTLFHTTLPIARLETSRNGTTVAKKFIVVSQNLQETYAAMLRCHSQGLAIAAIAPERISHASQSKVAEILVDEALTENKMMGKRVQLRQLPDIILSSDYGT